MRLIFGYIPFASEFLVRSSEVKRAECTKKYMSTRNELQQRQKFNREGYSLLELMIVITIISILAMVAIPSYQIYIQRARFAEVITATEIFKTAVTLALQQNIPFAELSNGKNGIPKEMQTTKNLASIKVDNGTITAMGTALVNNATYILKPNAEGTNWILSGTCLKNGLCHE